MYIRHILMKFVLNKSTFLQSFWTILIPDVLAKVIDVTDLSIKYQLFNIDISLEKTPHSPTTHTQT